MIHFATIEVGPEPGTNLTIQVKAKTEPCDSCNTRLVIGAYLTVDKGLYSADKLIELRNFLNQLNFGD